MNNLFQAHSSLHRINKNASMSSPVPDGTDFWAGKSGIWLIISFCNSLQLWINLGKGNSSGYVYYHYSHLWRKHILISDSWFLLPFLLFLLSTSVLYSILSYKCIQWVWSNLLYLLFKCGICCSQFFSYILGSLRSAWSYRIMVCGSLEVNINFVTVVFVSI